MSQANNRWTRSKCKACKGKKTIPVEICLGCNGPVNVPGIGRDCDCPAGTGWIDVTCSTCSGSGLPTYPPPEAGVPSQWKLKQDTQKLLIKATRLGTKKSATEAEKGFAARLADALEEFFKKEKNSA